MKVGRLGAVLASVTLMAGACGSGGGGSDTGGGATGGGAAGGPVDGKGKTLTVWIMEGTNKDPKPFFDEVKQKFAADTGASLDIQFVPFSAAHDKFTTAIAGGTTPDVAEVGTTWTPEFADAGALMDLTARVKANGGQEGLVTGLVESATLDKKLYGMPWYAGIRSFVYRKDLFQAAGVKAPTTWAELRDTATKLKATNPGITAFPVAGDSEYSIDTWVWGAGGDIATQDGKKWTCALDQPKARAGIAFYADLALKDGVSIPAATTWKETDLRDSFIKGQSAMIISGSWTPPAIIAKNADLKDKIGVFTIPGKDGGMSPSFVGGSHLSAFQTTKNPDLAWAFIKLMTYGDFAGKWGTQTGFFPGQKDLLQKVMAANDPLVTPFAKQFTDGGKSVPVTPAYGKVQGAKVITAMMQSILSGKATVEQATTSACTDMNRLLG
jgi:N,N'-diacetylchitobiose transport system substrate-binding protein